MGKGSQFYNRSMKPWLEKVAIEMYSTHNKGKYVFTERFIRTLTLSVQAMPFSGYTDCLHFSLFFFVAVVVVVVVFRRKDQIHLIMH